MQGERSGELERLMKSVSAAIADSGLRIRHFLLLQRCSGEMPVLVLPPHAEAIRISYRVSLSAARNMLLKQAMAGGVLNRSRWLAFPDDDAWYPAGLLKSVNTMFATEPELGILVCRYATEPYTLASLPGGIGAAFEPSTRQFVASVSSNTLMIRTGLALSTGYFDERLGMGAPISGGEDLDFALRAYIGGCRKALLFSAELVGHRDRIVWVRSRYYAGSLFALCRSSRRSMAVAVEAMRKLLVGFYLLLRNELTLNEWASGSRMGLSGWHEQTPLVSPADSRPT
jgi:hypothetical protein